MERHCALLLLITLLAHCCFHTGSASTRSPYACPPRCQCFDDPQRRANSIHLICKWEQLNTTVLSTLNFPDQVRTLTIRCPHHGRKISRPPDGLFQGLKNLDRLEIDRCLIDRLPGALFAGMNQLYSLIIKNAKMPDIPQGLFDYTPKLMTLDLTGSELKIEPYALRSLHNLVHLDLSNNSLNFLANTLGSLTKLRVLTLDHNKLTNIDFRRLPAEITDLSIRNNYITTVHYVQNGGANTLHRLDLSGNQIDFMTATGAINAFPPSLKQLDLSYNRITLVQDGSLQQTKKLTELNLSHNRLTEMRETSLTGPMQRLKIFLAENPLKCSCSLRWILHPSEKLTPKVEDMDQVTCTHLVDSSLRVNLTIADYRNELLCKYKTHCPPETCKCCEASECACRSSCPPGCQCYASSNDDEHSQNVVHCERVRPDSPIPPLATALRLNGFRRAWQPERVGPLPMLRSLNLSEGDLSQVDEATFASLGRLTTLDVSSNELRHVPHHLPSGLVHLRLSGNPLTTLRDSDLAILSRLNTITLGGNRTSHLCDCENPTPFQKWVTRHKKRVLDLEQVQCELPDHGRVFMTDILPSPHSLCKNASSNLSPEGDDDLDANTSHQNSWQPPNSTAMTTTTMASTTNPISIIKKTTNRSKITPKVVYFADEEEMEKQRRRASIARATTAKSPSPPPKPSSGVRRRGRHEPEHHKIVNALIFVLFICVIVLILAIGVTIYLRFFRSDVNLVRSSSSFEAQPLNR